MSQSVTPYSRVLTRRHEPLTCIHLSIQSQSFALIHGQHRTTYFHNVHPIMPLVRISWLKSARNSFFASLQAFNSITESHLPYVLIMLTALPKEIRRSASQNSPSAFILSSHKQLNYQSWPARQMLILPQVSEPIFPHKTHSEMKITVEKCCK